MPIARFQMPDGKIARFEVPEGTTPEAAQSMMQEYVGGGGEKPDQFIAEGVGRTALEQGLQGATFGISDEIIDALGAAGAKAYDILSGRNMMEGQSVGDVYDIARQESQARLQRQMEQNPATSIAANIGGALLTGGAGATTKGGQAAAKALTSGGTAARIAKGAGAGALSGGAYGFGTGSGDIEQRLENAKTGAALGGLTGGAIPAAGAAARGVGAAVLPKIDEALKPLGNRANELGIPLSIDQLSPTKFRKTLQKVSQEAPLAGVDDFIDAQRKSFNKAVARTIGQDADNLTPDVINKFLTDANSKFNVLAKGKKINISGDLTAKLDDIANEAIENVGEEIGGIVGKQAAKLAKELPEGTFNGSKIAAVRSNLVKRLPKVSPQARSYVADMISVIDEEIAPALSAAEKQTLQQARREWRNFKTIEPLLEKATDGNINPTQLLTRVAGSKYINASRSAIGQDDLVDLARIGKELLPISGGSDTFQKVATGGLLATAYFQPITAALAAGGIGLNRAFQKLYNQNPRLVQKLLEQGQKSGNYKGLVRAVANAAGRKAANTDEIGKKIAEGIIKNQSGSTGTIAPLAIGVGAAMVSDSDSGQMQKNLKKEATTFLNEAKAGTNAPYYKQLAMAESGGDYNAKAKTSSAYGKYQFTADTAKSLVNKYGDKIGVTLKDWKKPENQEKLARILTEENRAGLATMLERQPTPGEMYAAHFLGLGNAKKLLSRRNSHKKAASLFPKSAKANVNIFYETNDKGRPIRARSVYEVRQILNKKMEA